MEKRKKEIWLLLGGGFLLFLLTRPKKVNTATTVTAFAPATGTGLSGGGSGNYKRELIEFSDEFNNTEFY